MTGFVAVYSRGLCSTGMKTEMSRAIGKRRRELDITQEDLAKRLGVKQGAVSKWERGEAVPELPTLLDLAATLKVDVNYLVGGVTPSYKPLGLTSQVIASSTDGASMKEGVDVPAAADLNVLASAVDEIETALAGIVDRLGEIRTELDRAKPARRTQKRNRG